MPNPVLTSLHVYPLKAVQGHAPREAVVEPWGIAGDRLWMLIDSAGTVVTQRTCPGLALITAQQLPGGGLRLAGAGRETLMVTVPTSADTVTAQLHRDKVKLLLADVPAHDWFSDWLGTPVRLVHLDAPATRRPVDARYALPGETVSLADSHPLLLTSLSSLDALNALILQGRHAEEAPLPMNRFRPNVVVADAPPWAEDRWRRVAIGEVTFRVAKPCGRCVVTTVDQDTSQRGQEPLQTLGLHRRFGNQLVFGQKLIPETTGTLRVGEPVAVLE